MHYHLILYRQLKNYCLKQDEFEWKREPEGRRMVILLIVHICFESLVGSENSYSRKMVYYTSSHNKAKKIIRLLLLWSQFLVRSIVICVLIISERHVYYTSDILLWTKQSLFFPSQSLHSSRCFMRLVSVESVWGSTALGRVMCYHCTG